MKWRECIPGTESLLIAHRGASRDAPENTLAAFDLAWQQGADGIEADFRLTGDGRIVCLHDASTGRTAGVDLTVADVSTSCNSWMSAPGREPAGRANTSRPWRMC